MAAAISGRTVSATELLDVRERLWRDELAVVSLAAEALSRIKVSHREQTLRVLGEFYSRQVQTAARAAVLERWPAVHVLTTAGVAVDHWDGSFWPRLATMIGLRVDEGLRQEWGNAFLRNLRSLGLPAFDSGKEDAGTRYVGRILMHSGMPTFCLRDYFRLIGERRSRVDGLEPGELVSWAAARAQQNQLHEVDKPVARFVRYGGDFAVDVTDRAFELLDAVAAGGDGADVPLPERFRTVALQLRQEGALTRVRRPGNATNAGADHRPRLAIDPYGIGPILRLPSIGETPDGSAAWIVELDGVTSRVATRAQLLGLNEPVPQIDVPIPGPVRTAAAALAGRAHPKVALTVVDDMNPLLAFDEDGVAVPSGLPLPGRPIWLLYPGEPRDLRIAGEGHTLAHSPLPPGWAGWCLTLADLEGAMSVSVGEAGRVHAVRNLAAARILVDDPVRGVRTTTGLPVVSSVPRVVLPERLDDAEWDVTLLDGSGAPVAQWRSATAHGGPDAVWSSIPRPIVGSFTIRVRGPWGRGATRTVTVVEGLAVTFTPAWRRFVRGGLQRAEAIVTAGPGLEVSRGRIAFDERARESRVRVGAHGDFHTLVITPPHMTVAYQTTRTTSPPSVQPARLYREDVIEEPGTLIIDVGGAAEASLRAIASTGVIQTIGAGPGRAGVHQFNLARLVDTLRAEAQVQVALDDEAELPVAIISPRRLYRDVRLEADHLEFTECVAADGLTAFVYPARAPWRPPVELSIVGGRATLPADLTGAGPLLAHVRIEDPWAPLPIPDWPERNQFRLVESRGHVRAMDEEETALSAYLAGEQPLPTTITDYTRLWTIRSLLDDLALGDRLPSVAEDLDRALHADPRAALLALSESYVRSQAIPSLIIKAGLAWANLEQAHEDEPPVWSLRNALPSALLSAADAEWSAEEVHAATEVCGEVVTDLLAGKDPYARDGRLDAAAELFDKEPAIREEFVRQARLMPTGLLSGDARVRSAMEFVAARRDARLASLSRTADVTFGELQRLLRIIGAPAAQAAIDARRPVSSSHGWRLVPAISLGFAFAARYAARGHRVAAAWLAGNTRAWADLGTVVASMVTIDLILAELVVASTSSSPDLPTTSQLPRQPMPGLESPS